MVGSDRYNGQSVFQAKGGNLKKKFNMCLTFYRSWKRAKTSQKESWRRKDHQRHSQLFFILNLHLINMLYSRTHNQLILKDWKFSYLLDKKIKKTNIFITFASTTILKQFLYMWFGISGNWWHWHRRWQKGNNPQRNQEFQGSP